MEVRIRNATINDAKWLMALADELIKTDKVLKREVLLLTSLQDSSRKIYVAEKNSALSDL